MVRATDDEVVERDYSRASLILISIGLRILEEEESDEPDPGLRASLD